MFLIRLGRTLFLPAVAITLASTLLLGGRASAQKPRPVYVAPDVKGFQTQRMLQQPTQQPAAVGPRIPAAHPAAATGSVTQTPAVQVTLSFPNVENRKFVAIRGPEGEVRYFPVEGGQEGTRVIVVRPGERVFIQLPPPSPK